jgi:hypothetical protein
MTLDLFAGINLIEVRKTNLRLLWLVCLTSFLF